jgi:hypothetical protein|tara:strand:- start:206 stop:364 length:159 start_codon:yes stop_codon:yes gene_type:complete
MLLKEVGTVEMTVEALERIEKLLAKQIKKEKKKIESWDADAMLIKLGMEENE